MSRQSNVGGSGFHGKSQDFARLRSCGDGLGFDLVLVGLEVENLQKAQRIEFNPLVGWSWLKPERSVKFLQPLPTPSTMASIRCECRSLHR
mgnify:CR=1 FL=1